MNEKRPNPSQTPKTATPGVNDGPSPSGGVVVVVGNRVEWRPDDARWLLCGAIIM